MISKKSKNSSFFIPKLKATNILVAFLYNQNGEDNDYIY